MKIKCLPEDFRVEELSLAQPGGAGRHTFYRLTKRDLGTIEAVGAICRRWDLAGRRVSYAGLKDRHARTVQFLTIADGPFQSMRTAKFELEPVGHLERAYTSQELRGNRFELVLRGLTETELARAVSELETVPKVGLSNYFDDQRFGSVGISGEFVAHAWLRGDHERALRLAIAEPNPFDRAAAKAEKAILRTRWGDWPTVKARLPHPTAGRVVTYLLDHHTDYRGAFARLSRELRLLYFSAFQSHLWNLVLARWLQAHAAPDQLVGVSLKVGTFPFPARMATGLAQRLGETMLPLPCARSPLPEGLLGAIAVEVLKGFGLAWSGLRAQHLPDIFFSKGARPCLFVPQDLTFSPMDDDRYPGRRGLRLSFELTKGSYATILVKRITDAAGPS